jgi:hypothetical protein
MPEEFKEVNSLDRGFIYMVAYELFSYDEKKGYEFIGILPERRKDPKRITKKSVVNWGRMVLGNDSYGKKILFNRVTMEDVTGRTFEANSPFKEY